MLEIRITAPELTEAINNFTKAITSLAGTIQIGTTTTAVPSNTIGADANTPAQTEVPPMSEPTPTVVPTVQPVPTAQTAPQPEPAPAPTAIPTAAPQYTLEMIAKAGTALVDAGRTADVSALLARYGVEVLTALDPSMYGAIAMELRAMGAQI